jgi:hypothetical protein
MTSTFNRNAVAKGGYRGSLRESCRITMPAHAPQGLVRTATWDSLKSVETAGVVTTATINQPILLNLSLVAQSIASPLGKRIGTTANSTWYMAVPSTVDFTVSNNLDTFSYTIEGTDAFGDPLTENGAKTATTSAVCRSMFVFSTITRITVTPTVATGGTSTATLAVGRDMLAAPAGQRFHLPFKLDTASYVVGLQMMEVPVGWTTDLSMSLSRTVSTATTTITSTTVVDGGANPWGAGITLDSSFVGQYLWTASAYGIITAVNDGTKTITVGGGWVSRADPNTTATTPSNGTTVQVTYTYQKVVRGIQGDASQPQNADTAIANNNVYAVTPNILARTGVGAFISSQLFTTAGVGNPEARWIIVPGGFLDR